MKTRFTLKYLFYILLLSFSQKVVAQCFQIESILVAACVPAANPNSEGYNEMVRLRIGPNPVNTSGLNINWPAQAWQGSIQNATTQAAVASINANIQAAGSCHQLIEPVGGVIPANAAVVIVTSQNFSSSSNVFGALTEDVYIIFQNNTTVTAGHFGNYNATPGIRTLSMNFGFACTDTVSYERSNLANGAGASVNFTAAGVATYPQNPSCVAPVAVYTVDAGAAQTVCPGDIVSLTGTTNAPVIVGWTAPSGTFSSPTTLTTNFTVPSNATGSIVLTLAVKGGTCTVNTITDTVTLTLGAGVMPTFNAVPAICTGATLTALPTTSINGIIGTWSPALDNTTTTVYTFTPNVGQCATTATLTITVNPIVTPTFNAVAPICAGTALAPLPTTSLNGITGSWSPALTNTVTRTYTFTPDAGQCASTALLTITVNPANTNPIFSFGTSYCIGSVVPPLPTTSVNAITGTWSPAVDSTTTTTYTFTPDPNQCAVPITRTITITPLITPTFNPVPNICQGTTITLPATSISGVAGTWTPAFNSNATTTYTFTPNPGGCYGNGTLTVTVIPNVTPIFNPVAPICVGGTLATLPPISTNGIVGNWSPALNNTATTIYTFTPSAGQCAPSVQLTITVNPIVTPTFNTVPAVCSGATISALPTTSTNGITGTWAPALNNVATTVYTFTPTTGQCATTAQLTIVVTPLVVPTFNAVSPVCIGNAVSPLPTTSTNGIIGSWSPAINNTATTTYTFTPNVGQCASNVTLTINVNATNTLPTFSPVAAICQGGFLAPLPTTSTNGIIGSWSPALNNNATTTYTFVPNAGQCAINTTLAITVTPPSVTPTFNSIPPICSGTTLAPLPTTSLEGILGVWTPAINNTATTTYTFSPNQGQCGLTTTITIIVNTPVVPTFNAFPSICRGVALTALPPTSNNGITGTWSPAPNNTATTTYTFTPNPGQCATNGSLTITINQPVLPTFNAIPAICNGATLTPLPTTSTNGIVGTWSPILNNTVTTTYTFTPNPGQCATINTLTITVNPKVNPTFNIVPGICTGGTFPTLPTTSTNGITGTWTPTPSNTVTRTYTFVPNTGECANLYNWTITIYPNITPTFTQVAPTCHGEPIAALPTTSNNLITGTWSPAINNTATTTYTFTPDPGPCAVTTTMTIVVNPLTIPLFDPTTIPISICEGGALAPLPTLSQNGFTGTWSPALNNLATTTYTFTPDSGQCADINALTISVIPNLRENKAYHLCVDSAGNPINPTTIETGLTAATHSFEWAFNGNTIAHTGDSYLIDAAGIYTVVATSLLTGCKTNTIFAEVFFIPPATAVATITNEFEDVQQIVINVTGGIQPAYFEYQLGNGPWQKENTFAVDHGGEYTIYVRDNLGCNSFELKVRALNYPKFFTPNGDGYNDTWNIEGLLPSQKAEIFIFDRYGKLMKHLSPYGTGWDGMYNGRELPSTDYWFKLLYLDEYGTPKEFGSHFSLKR